MPGPLSAAVASPEMGAKALLLAASRAGGLEAG
jgi:hypothetical protein